MKRQILILLAIAALATTLTTTAFGQMGKTSRANVKFDFQIGERTYPAGEYRIESISGQSDNILLIRNVGHPNKKQIILANHSMAGEGTPKLVFQRYGENYFLTQIFLDTDLWGYSITPSDSQRASKKDLPLASLKKN